MDPTLESQLTAYFNSEPIFASEYSRVQASGDRRSPAEWMLAHIQSSPGDQEKFNAMVQGTQAGGTPDLPADQLNDLIARADAGDAAAIEALRAAGYEQTSDTETLPLEQGILQTALPGLLGDIEGDAGRRELVNTLTGQATADYEAARAALSPEENARRLAEEYAMADETTGRISASAGTAAAEQLAALQASVAAMQQNLTGDLAARAAALQQQIASFTQNLDAFDATQRAALAQQIADTQQNLEQSVAAQRLALTDEMTALRGAADANSVARRAALQAEIDGLTAAQAPMAQARLDSANALTTAVNLGLQSTNDQLTATRAKQGYLGSSTFSDAALARAAIGARQDAAQIMGGAREANASDLRAIEARRATEGRTLADELANAELAIAGREATGERTLADVLAEGTRTIGDTGAAGTAAITAATGASRQGIGNAGATQLFQDQTMGSTQLRDLLDALAKGQAGIAGERAVAQQTARDTGTAARKTYFDNAYTRGLGGTLARPAMGADLAKTLTSLGDYGNSGLGRTLGALDWWATNPGAAPTPGFNAAPADTSGNAIASLGAGLVGTAASLGNATDWGKTKKNIPVVNTYETPSTTNWWDS